MKLYRNNPWNEKDSSLGFRWFATEKEAVEEAEANPEDYKDLTADYAEEFSIAPSKDGVLALLRRVATHPDNG